MNLKAAASSVALIWLLRVGAWKLRKSWEMESIWKCSCAKNSNF